MTQIIRAAFEAVELRVPTPADPNNPEERIVEGIVVPWDEISFLTPDPKGERFLRGSLTRSIAERGPKIKLFKSHDHREAVGLAVSWNVDDPRGLWGKFQIRTGPIGDDVLGAAREGMSDAFSVGFRPMKSRRGADGAREIVEAALHEVSIAPLGAYEGAQVLAVRTMSTLDPMPVVDLTPLPPLSRW